MPPKNRALVALLAIPSIVLLGFVLHKGAGILQPLVIALLLASLLSPVVRALARFRIPPTLSVLGMVSLLGLGLTQAVFLVRSNVEAFLGASERAHRENYGVTESEDEAIRSFGGWEAIAAELQRRIEASSLPTEVQGYLSQELRSLDVELLATEFLGGGFGILRSILMVAIYMLFIFAEQAVFRRKILSVAGERRDDAATILDTIGRGIQRFLGIKTLISIATGALAYVVLVALDIPYALLWGFLTFLLNFIPYFGSILAGALPTVTALAVKSSWETAALVAMLYTGINLGLGTILEPRIMGRELDLSPLVILVSVVVWGSIWGVVGTFLAVPIMATLQIVCASNEATRPFAVLLSSGPPKATRPNPYPA
jgi:AI-2 transport protein TqsA